MRSRTVVRLLLVAALWPALAVAQTPPPAGTIEYYHVDALGSVRAVTNASGAVVRTHHYHPFGEAVGAASGTDPLRFTGKPRDAETGLDYFGARYYAGRTGRFTTVDPILDVQMNLADPQRWNRYAYSLNSPLTFIDPTGEVPILAAVAVIATSRFLATPQGQRLTSQLARYGQQLGSVTLTRGQHVAKEVFSLGPVVRGRVIEALTGAPDAFRNVRGIDNFAGGVAVSIKSVDIFAKSYQNLNRLGSTLSSYVQQLASYQGGNIPGRVLQPSDIEQRVLNVVLPQGNLTAAQQELLLKIQRDGAAMGVQVLYTQAK